MKNGYKTNRAVKLSSRDDYILNHSPIILSALIMRRDSISSNDRVDLAIETAGQIFDLATTKERRVYLLENVPIVLSSLLLRRGSTNPKELIIPALTTVSRIYDIVYELDIPAEAMTSQPVSLQT